MGVVEEKSRKFAIRIVKLYKYLCEEKNERVLSKQLLRAGTSIGANIAEADYAISRSDFLAKTYISLKETAETIYWLKMLKETEYITSEQYESVYTDAEELRRLLSSITKTTKSTPHSSLLTPHLFDRREN